MIAQVKAELLKIRTTRTTIGIVLGMVALVLLFSLLAGLLTITKGGFGRFPLPLPLALP